MVGLDNLREEEWLEDDELEEDDVLDEIVEKFEDDPEVAIERAEELGFDLEDILDRV